MLNFKRILSELARLCLISTRRTRCRRISRLLRDREKRIVGDRRAEAARAGLLPLHGVAVRRLRLHGGRSQRERDLPLRLQLQRGAVGMEKASIPDDGKVRSGVRHSSVPG